MNHAEIEAYCKARLEDIRKAAQDGTPLGFLCLAAFVDFLAKLAEGVDKKDCGYKNLITNYFPDAYKNFTFSSRDKDLPVQFYHVFRCGILHAFSLYPDKPNRSDTITRTIVISHDGKDGCKTYCHLDNYKDNGLDAAVLIADKLCDDVSAAIEKMFKQAIVQRNSEKWVKKQPPMQTLGIRGTHDLSPSLLLPSARTLTLSPGHVNPKIHG